MKLIFLSFCFILFQQPLMALSVNKGKNCIQIKLDWFDSEIQLRDRAKSFFSKIECHSKSLNLEKQIWRISLDTQKGILIDMEATKTYSFKLDSNYSFEKALLEVILRHAFSWNLVLPEYFVGLTKTDSHQLEIFDPYLGHSKKLLEEKEAAIGFPQFLANPRYFSYAKIESGKSSSQNVFDLHSLETILRIPTPHSLSSGSAFNKQCDKFLTSLYDKDGHGVYEYELNTRSWRLLLHSPDAKALSPVYANYRDYFLETNRRQKGVMEILKISSHQKPEVQSHTYLDSHMPRPSPNGELLAFVSDSRIRRLAMNDLSNNQLRGQAYFSKVNQIQWINNDNLMISEESPQGQIHSIYNWKEKNLFTWKIDKDYSYLLYPPQTKSNCSF